MKPEDMIPYMADLKADPKAEPLYHVIEKRIGERQLVPYPEAPRFEYQYKIPMSPDDRQFKYRVNVFENPLTDVVMIVVMRFWTDKFGVDRQEELTAKGWREYHPSTHVTGVQIPTRDILVGSPAKVARAVDVIRKELEKLL